MQHQQQGDANTNGAGAELQVNGNTDTTQLNGETEVQKPVLKLNTVNKQMVRIIGQYLSNAGFQSTVDELMQESGCALDHPEAIRLRTSVLSGNWAAADKALQSLRPLLKDEAYFTEMQFLILEQKYLELIEGGDDIGALNCLRGEISPLSHNVTRVHRLSSLIFYNNPEELRKCANWLGSGQESRSALMDQLSKYLPASVMLPPRRMETLLGHAIQFQVSQCVFHNSLSLPITPSATLDTLAEAAGSDTFLLTDHTCSKDSFPTTCLYTVTEHTDEVLIAAFSPDGKLLATAGKDCTLLIWDVDRATLSISRKHLLESHNYSIVFLVWSNDSSKIIACFQEDGAQLTVFDAVLGKCVCKVTDTQTDSLTSACWYKDDSKFVCGGIRGQFLLCALDGSVLERWEGVRVQNLAMDHDGVTVLASDTHRRIRGYQLEDVKNFDILQEDHGILSFTMDSSGRFALLNVTTQGVHLWDVKEKTLVRKYRGTKQAHCTIYSCFGGSNEDFVASGSEDNDVYIWHRNKELPVAVLHGHKRTVNCVTWNPTLPSMLASVSDDHTIRIWGPANTSRKNDRHPTSSGVGASDDDDDDDDSPMASNGRLPHSLLSSLDISGH